MSAHVRRQRPHRLLLPLRECGTDRARGGCRRDSGQANIRLRRVADQADAKTIDATPAWRENLDRMNRDYVVPRPADPQWADVIVLATPSDSCAEIESYCASLRSIAPMSERSRRRSRPAMRNPRSSRSTRRLPAPGWSSSPAKTDSGIRSAAAREYGQRITEMARSLKKAVVGLNGPRGFRLRTELVLKRPSEPGPDPIGCFALNTRFAHMDRSLGPCPVLRGNFALV